MPVYPNYVFTDQLVDTTINLNAYIERYSDTRFSLNLNNKQPVVATVKNLFEYSDLIENFKERGGAYTVYYISDGELPEDVAIKYYGSEDFWWAVLLFNDMTNPMTDWPLTNTQLITLKSMYATAEDKYSEDGYYELLFDWNETKRRIEVLRLDHLYELIGQFKERVFKLNTTSKLNI